MGIAQGYSSIVTNGLVFAYDVADSYNSYRGQPGTNITTGPNRNYSGYSKENYSNGYFFETNGYTETVNIPALGPTVVQSIEINNVYCGYGCEGNYNCCPNLFNYTGGWNSAIWSPSTTYTYQIIYKCQSGYTNANYMYHYEYNSGGGYLTEYGVHTTAYEEPLGDGWYHAWNTFTTQPTAALGYTGLWYYQYNVDDKVSIAAVSIAQGNTIRPARQLIPSGTTRSNTQGLLNLTSNTNVMDLSNVSFDSNAQMYFDGINDFINIPSSNVFDVSEVTVEVVVKPNGLNQNGFWFEKGSVNTQYSLFMEGTNIVWRQAVNSQYTSTSTMTNNAWNHVVGTFKSGERKTYVNGTLMTSDSLSYTLNTGQGNQFIGSYNSGGYYYNGYIAIVKVYNKVLSAGEVLQNFNHYKTRYNISPQIS